VREMKRKAYLLSVSKGFCSLCKKLRWCYEVEIENGGKLYLCEKCFLKKGGKND